MLNKRKVSYNELKKIREFPIFRLGKNKGGLIEVMSSTRLQPHVNLASRTIGYLNEAEDGSFEGRVGIEGAFENELKGIPGRSVKQMMSGTWVPVTVEEPEDGNDVITTIDVDYQDIVQHALLRQMEKFEADKGCAVLMEVKTGDVKAIANLTRTTGGTYRESMNYAIGDAGEPGSVIKAATMIALLEDGYVEPDDTVDLGGTGRYQFYENYLTDSDNKKPGKISIRHVFETSSNGIAKIVYDHYRKQPERFVNRWCGLGLDKSLGVRLKGEGEPYIKHPGEKEWTGITLPWMSIGYELKITPLQVLAFYNAIANDGQRMRPRFVKEIRNRGRIVESFEPEEVGGRLCSRSTLKKYRRCWRVSWKTGRPGISGPISTGLPGRRGQPVLLQERKDMVSGNTGQVLSVFSRRKHRFIPVLWLLIILLCRKVFMRRRCPVRFSGRLPIRYILLPICSMGSSSGWRKKQCR